MAHDDLTRVEVIARLGVVIGFTVKGGEAPARAQEDDQEDRIENGPDGAFEDDARGAFHVDATRPGKMEGKGPFYRGIRLQQAREDKEIHLQEAKIDKYRDADLGQKDIGEIIERDIVIEEGVAVFLIQ